MRVSVVTVAFNSGRTIADTLRSVANQDHPDIEHIVIDGGSTDDTLVHVRRSGDSVSRLVSEPDLGIYDAMNKGLRLARGDFVGFLNADDMFAKPDTLSRLARAMCSADIVYGDLVYVDALDTTRVVRRWRSGQYHASRLRFGWMPPHPTFYVRRDWLGVLEFDQRLRIAADYDFMLRSLVLASPRVTYVPEVLVHMRNGGASNRSLAALWRKSREDLQAMRRSQVGGLFTLAAKNLRKLPQLLSR